MNLFEHLGQKEPLKVAVVGAGGKTTTVFQLAHQVSGKSWMTTTTHLGTDQLHLADHHFILTSVLELDPVLWLHQKVTLLTGEPTLDDRMRGLEPALLDQIDRLADREQVSLIIEADGARSHPLKAPAEHEPVIPPWVKTVIVVVGLSAISKPLSPEWVHRSEIYTHLTNLQAGQPISLASMIDMLVSPEGGLKGIPSGARRVVLFNQLDTHPLTSIEKELLKRLAADYDLVLAGSLAIDASHLLKIA